MDIICINRYLEDVIIQYQQTDVLSRVSMNFIISVFLIVPLVLVTLSLCVFCASFYAVPLIISSDIGIFKALNSLDLLIQHPSLLDNTATALPSKDGSKTLSQETKKLFPSIRPIIIKLTKNYNFILQNDGYKMSQHQKF